MDAQHLNESKGLDFSISETEKRARSPHRIHYEAQVEVIRKQLGDLEDIRRVLGLSQRKICQLLMVDPSAWTRWTKKGESAPPHIFRALQWYMILQEKLPGLTPQYFVGKDPEILHQNALQKIQMESQKRQEFEEAVSIQSIRMEAQIKELSEQNDLLSSAKEQLESQVLKLRSDILKSRYMLFTVLFAMVIVGLYFLWR
jgi:transcriptional regulator with XRE-family HTH domain